MYERLTWDYKNADFPSINRAIDIFDWGDSLEGKNFHEQVHFFNKTILKIFQNYVPKKAILLMIKIHRGLIMKLEKY